MQNSLTNRIGPNAITRVIESLSTLEPREVARAVFQHAQIEHYFDSQPAAMVPESAVTALQSSLVTELGIQRGRAVSRQAGLLTGDYLLRHRIPLPVQAVLRCLPNALSRRALLRAISRHAWTFCGSGKLKVHNTRPLELAIEGCPLCKNITAHEPVCDYYAATFERLFQTLISRTSTVTEVACQADGAAKCVFLVRL